MQVKVGDYVTWKEDMEVSGKVMSIANGLATVQVYDSNEGDYFQQQVQLRRLSVEN